MGILGAVGAGLKVGGAIYGGIKASQAMRRLKRQIKKQKQANKDWYDRRYNEDATQRADAQRLLQMTEERIKQRNRAASGAAAVGGASTEAAAQQAAANSNAMSDTIAAINAQNVARKEQIENKYQDTNLKLDESLANHRALNAQNIINAADIAVNRGSEIASLIPDKEKNEGENTEGEGGEVKKLL